MRMVFHMWQVFGHVSLNLLCPTPILDLPCPVPCGAAPSCKPWGSTSFFFSSSFFFFSCVNSNLRSSSLSLPWVTSTLPSRSPEKVLISWCRSITVPVWGFSHFLCPLALHLFLHQDVPSPHWLAFLPFCSVPHGAGDTGAWGPDGLGVSL